MEQIPEEILSRVKELLGEHAEAFVLIIEKEDDETKTTQTYADWGGGLSRCIGMATRIQNRLVRNANDKD